MAPSSPIKRKVGMISLGCAKNLVDAEIMLGGVLNRGMEITSDADEADVLIVNTCAFIDSAKEESIEAILEAHQSRGLKKRAGQKLIVSGCMAQRFAKELSSEMPEVDAFIGLDQVADTAAIIDQVFARPPDSQLADSSWEPLNLVTRKPVYIPDYDTPRFRLTPAHTAFTKIAEGCNHPVQFLRHPANARQTSLAHDRVRGRRGPRPRRRGREGNQFDQPGHDLLRHGSLGREGGPARPVDSSRGPTLTKLLRELDTIEGEFWIRLLYTHPAHWSDELIETIAASKKVARYIDMPLQHIHPRMLDLMRRETSSEHIENLIARIPRWHSRHSPCAPRSSSVFRARRRRSSIACSISSNARASSASAFSPTRRRKVRAPRRWTATFAEGEKPRVTGRR
jgi:ribosomal protein S12 methylthiotransferase